MGAGAGEKGWDPMRHGFEVCRRGSRSLVLLLVPLIVIPLTLACGGGGGEETASPAAAVTSAATPAGTAAAGEAAPGITDTEILLGQHAMLSGTFGAVYAIL